MNLLFFVVLGDMLLLFARIIPHVLWPAARFFLDFQPRVDVLFKEPYSTLIFWEMPHLVNVKNLIPLLHRLFKLGGTPRHCGLSLLGGVRADIASNQHHFFTHLFFDTSAPQRKRELVINAPVSETALKLIRSLCVIIIDVDRVT